MLQGELMNIEWQAILNNASAMDEASDRELGRELEAVVRQHARFIYQIAYLLLRNHHDAEDATQETFMRVWRYRKRLPEARDLKAWLARVAWRAALDRRKNVSEISLTDAAESVFKLYAAGESAEKIAGDKQMAVLLDQLIATLPGKLRDPMLLSLDQELTQAEIGRVLNIPESSVRTRLFRARQMLRQKLSSILEGKNARR
jgi:RNA polymerase sigma-70 factor (ECF subfamily)